MPNTVLQGPTNYGSWDKSSPPSGFVNKVLLEYIHAHLFTYCQAIRAELILERPHSPWSLNYYLVLYRECLLTSALLYGCSLIYLISPILINGYFNYFLTTSMNILWACIFVHLHIHLSIRWMSRSGKFWFRVCAILMDTILRACTTLYSPRQRRRPLFPHTLASVVCYQTFASLSFW